MQLSPLSAAGGERDVERSDDRVSKNAKCIYAEYLNKL